MSINEFWFCSLDSFEAEIGKIKFRVSRPRLRLGFWSLHNETEILTEALKVLMSKLLKLRFRVFDLQWFWVNKICQLKIFVDPFFSLKRFYFSQKCLIKNIFGPNHFDPTVFWAQFLLIHKIFWPKTLLGSTTF